MKKEMEAVKTPEQESNLIQYKKNLGRREILGGLAMGGAGIAATAFFISCGDSTIMKVAAASPTEADVLNFALNLEYLEASFYLVATTGSGLSSADTGGTGTVSGGNKVTFTDSRLSDIANEIAKDELAHVRFLRTALGSAAVSQPNINLAALGIGFAGDNDFLNLARAFEDTGVSAYAGAATLLTAGNLQAAAQILAVEAYHAGNVRLEIVQKGITAAKTDSLDIPPTESAFFPVDANALALKRTPSQVLAIVYANAASGTTSGGFFPNGLNGNIKTV